MGKLLTHQIRVETEEEERHGDDRRRRRDSRRVRQVLQPGRRFRGSGAPVRRRPSGLPPPRPLRRPAKSFPRRGRAGGPHEVFRAVPQLDQGAVKDLLASKLLVLVEQGGVTPDGQNETNVYQLMVPADPSAPRRSCRKRTVKPPSRPSNSDPSRAPLNPPGVRQRTPTRLASEPPAGPVADPEPVRRPTHRGAHPDWSGGAADGPVFRSNKEIEDSSRLAADETTGAPPRVPLDAAALLVEKGVEPGAVRVARRGVPARADRGRRRDDGIPPRGASATTPAASSAMHWSASGKPRARWSRRGGKPRPASASRSASGSHDPSAGGRPRLNDEEGRLQQLIDGLDDDELAILAESVLRKYDGNAAVLQVLTRKPPRQCRLMKMEIAAMLGKTAGAKQTARVDLMEA